MILEPFFPTSDIKVLSFEEVLALEVRIMLCGCNLVQSSTTKNVYLLVILEGISVLLRFVFYYVVAMWFDLPYQK